MKKPIGIGVFSNGVQGSVMACMEAVFAHTTTPYQIVLALPDEHPELFECLQEPLIAVVSGPERGLAGARNRVLHYLLERTEAETLIVIRADFHPERRNWELPWCDGAQQSGFVANEVEELAPSDDSEPGSALPLDCFAVSRDTLRVVGYFETDDHSGSGFRRRIGRHLTHRDRGDATIPAAASGLRRLSADKPETRDPSPVSTVSPDEMLWRNPWKHREEAEALTSEVGSAAAAAVLVPPLRPQPVQNRERLVVPWGTSDCERRWEGRVAPKPWEYRVSAIIPHLETPEQLRVCVDLLRLQTVRPYLMVVDTGSSLQVRQEIEMLRADDLEIHYVAAHAYQHSSEAVGVAQDLAFALCRSEYLFCTHADCFLRRRDYIEWLLTLCDRESPAVGYQMSPRDWLTDQWRGMVSHTGTLLHMPTMHRLGVTWSFERAHHQFGIDRSQPAWPDTETCMNLVLKAAGVKPLLIGPEENYVRHVDDNLDHCRSYAGAKVLGDQHYAKAERWMVDALQEARERMAFWKQQPLHPGRAQHLVHSVVQEPAPMSETAKYRQLLEPYCSGIGVEVGGGGDPLHRHAIQVDVDPRWGQLIGNAKELRWFPDGTLDYVYASHVLEHFDDWVPVIREWARAVKPGGAIMLLCADRERFAAAVQNGQPPNSEHRHLGSPGDVSGILRSLGGWEILFDDLIDRDGSDYNILFIGRKA